MRTGLTTRDRFGLICRHASHHRNCAARNPEARHVADPYKLRVQAVSTNRLSLAGCPRYFNSNAGPLKLLPPFWFPPNESSLHNGFATYCTFCDSYQYSTFSVCLLRFVAAALKYAGRSLYSKTTPAAPRSSLLILHLLPQRFSENAAH